MLILKFIKKSLKKAPNILLIQRAMVTASYKDVT